MGVSSQYVASSASIADGAVTEAKLAAQACSAAKMKKEGTATHVLTSNGAGAVPSYQAAAVATSSFVPIEKITLGAANQYITSAAITADTYASFYIEFDLIGKTSDAAVGIQFNSDTGANQYVGNRYGYKNATLIAGDRSLAYLEIIGNENFGAGQKLQGFCFVGNELAGSFNRIGYGTSIMTDTDAMHDTCYYNFIWKSTTQISTIRFYSSQQFETASQITIWGIKKV